VHVGVYGRDGLGRRDREQLVRREGGRGGVLLFVRFLLVQGPQLLVFEVVQSRLGQVVELRFKLDGGASRRIDQLRRVRRRRCLLLRFD